MQTARIFNNGNSQAVRLPKEFRFDEDEVIIKKVGNMIILLAMFEEIEREYAHGAARAGFRMSFYLLDTNICIFLLNQRQGFERIVLRMDGLERSQVGLSAIAVAELEFGVAASKRQGDNFKRLDRFLVDFEVLPFDRDAAKPYGALRNTLKNQETPIGPLDFLIAAHALALKATLVTNNTCKFMCVPGLAVEDWSTPS